MGVQPEFLLLLELLLAAYYLHWRKLHLGNAVPFLIMQLMSDFYYSYFLPVCGSLCFVVFRSFSVLSLRSVV